MILNYNQVRHIAELGQDTYKNSVGDAQGFVDQFKRNIQ